MGINWTMKNLIIAAIVFCSCDYVEIEKHGQYSHSYYFSSINTPEELREFCSRQCNHINLKIKNITMRNSGYKECKCSNIQVTDDKESN